MTNLDTQYKPLLQWPAGIYKELFFTYGSGRFGPFGTLLPQQWCLCLLCYFIGSLFLPLVADLGTNSVSGTLSSLQHSNPRDDFDMFAQTRGSSLAEQRKKYVAVCSSHGIAAF